MESHAHEDFHEMIFVVRGEIETVFADRTVRGTRGDVLMYPAGVAHAERATGRTSMEIIYVSWMQTDLPPDFSKWPLLRLDREGRIGHLVRWMQDLWPPATPGDRRALDALAATAVFEYRRLVHESESDMVRRVRRFIQARLAEPLALDDLAAAAGLSRYHFARAFKQAAGETPMRMLRRLRVEAARSMILRTPLPLKAVAREVGLADEYHLSRVFRQIAGHPPGMLRKGKRGTERKSS